MATIPVALCVVWMWGTMYAAGIPMNVMTLMIASLTVGYGRDLRDTRHPPLRGDPRAREHRDGRGQRRGQDRGVAAGRGPDLAGFAAIIGFSLLPPIQEFGLITAIAITYSFLASVFVLPAFLVIWARARAKRNSKGSD